MTPKSPKYSDAKVKLKKQTCYSEQGLIHEDFRKK